ncbi:uncharacterized protein LOC126382108 isoform X2 [Pectinophora gossypiella]|nr:uncharacterized protein LOC126382108 isoform X2 [Pectinophora gossypiella]
MQYAHKGIYTCTKCDTVFNSDAALRIHMKMHKPEAERKYHCSHGGCDKSFNFAHHLKHHELTHTDSKQHFCNECGKGFIQLHHLKVHQRKHKPDCWLACTELNCNKQFANEYALKRHIATHKNKIRPRASSRSSSVECKQIELKVRDLVLHTNQHISRNIQKDKINCFSTIDPTAEVDTKLTPQIEDIRLLSQTEEFKRKEAFVNDMGDEDTVIFDCKSVLGCCIVTGDSDTNDKCICAQIPKTGIADQDYDLIPRNRNVTITLNDDLKCDKLKNVPNACDSCECASVCGMKTKNSVTEPMPELENRNDGIVKIKETFDADIASLRIDEEIESEYKTAFKDFNSVAVNTCKDVLGNCIVSGNGTIGEGCLCAKMTATDQQMMAQEIEDITPCPKETWLTQRL